MSFHLITQSRNIVFPESFIPSHDGDLRHLQYLTHSILTSITVDIGFVSNPALLVNIISFFFLTCLSPPCAETTQTLHCSF